MLKQRIIYIVRINLGTGKHQFIFAEAAEPQEKIFSPALREEKEPAIRDPQQNAKMAEILPISECCANITAKMTYYGVWHGFGI